MMERSHQVKFIYEFVQLRGAATMAISHATSGSNRLIPLEMTPYGDGNVTVSSVAYADDALSLVGTDKAFDQGQIDIWNLAMPVSGTHDVSIACEFLYSRSAHTGVSAFSGVNLSMPP